MKCEQTLIHSQMQLRRLLLHARQLAFARLSDGARVNVAADGGEAWQALMQAFDWAE